MGKQLDLGTSLRQTRQAVGWTGNAVAQKLGISAAAYRRYERGEVDPSASTVLQLSDIYGRTLDAVTKYGGVEDPAPKTGRFGGFQIQVTETETFHIEITGWTTPK
tara:strand:- start:2895 stop:3212 length:318 start_codon:yes stop_codon:yes gene_type:complete